MCKRIWTINCSIVQGTIIFVYFVVIFSLVTSCICDLEDTTSCSYFLLPGTEPVSPAFQTCYFEFSETEIWEYKTSAYINCLSTLIIKFCALLQLLICSLVAVTTYDRRGQAKQRYDLPPDHHGPPVYTQSTYKLTYNILHPPKERASTLHHLQLLKLPHPLFLPTLSIHPCV